MTVPAAMTPASYRAAYLQAFAPAVAAATEAFALPARVYFRPERASRAAPTFEQLYAAGVQCGHPESLAALALRAREADAMKQALEVHAEARRLEQELGEARATYGSHVRSLEQAVEAARDRVRTLEESTSWRMTAPVRHVVHRAKLTARSARSVAHAARLLPARLATARQILKDSGPVELARRIVAKVSTRSPMSHGLRRREVLDTAIAALHVPASDSPRISVIVPTYGQDLHTFSCLKALARDAALVPLEVIVMDDCAPVAASEALAEVTGVRFERNAQNLGFVRNCNKGATLARGEFLLFLNNDAVPMPGAIEALQRLLDARPQAGAVGARLVYPDGRLQEAGAIVWRDGSAWNYGRGDDPGKPEYNYVREVDYCSGACLLVRRDLFSRLGGFDERYAPAYCEDSDFCFRAREAGLSVWYQPAAEVVHHEGVSHGTRESEGLKRHQVENRAKLHERWKATLGTHRVNGVQARLERDRGAKRRILLVDACMLTPDQDSGSVRTARTIRVMQSMGCKVTFVADNLECREPYAGELRQEGVEVLHWPHTRSVEGYIEVHGAEFDVIVLSRYYVATRYIAAARRHAPRALLVLDTHDLHFLRTRRLAELESSRALAQSALAIREQELDCIRRMDVTWVVSPVEREVLAKEVPQARVIVATNIHYPAGTVLPFAGREGILFVGGYRHPPNVDAALFYAREIAPHLRELLPGVVTYLVGSNPPQVLRELSGDGIEFVGFVPDLEPWFGRCRMSVSPLRYGAGVKGKINHSMSFGLPVVATTPSVEGMHLAEGEEILVADDPRAFAEAMARLYGDEALWNRLSRAGIENVRRHFSPEAARRALEETFALAAGAGGCP